MGELRGFDRRAWIRAASSGGVLLVAIAASFLLHGVLGLEFSYFLYLLAIVVCTFVGGLIAGLLATLVSGLCIVVFLLEPIYSVGVGSADERIRLLQFLFEGAVLSVFGNWFRNGKQSHVEHVAARYGFPVLLIACAVVLKLLLLRSIGSVVPFGLFYAAITASTWIGGAGPGVLATVLSAASGLFFFIAPLGAFTADDPVEASRIALFVAEALLLVAMAAMYRQSRLTAIVLQRESSLRARTLQKRVQAMFEANPIGLALIDRDLGVFRCNGAFVKLCGANRAELDGQPLTRFVEPETAARLRKEVAGVLDAPHGTPHFEATWSPDGIVSVSARLVALPEADGKPIHAGLLCEDISERLKTQAELEKSQSLLRQAEKMEAVGRLAGGVAHDFNNLLAVIIGYTGMLAKRLPEGDPRRTDVQEIGKAAERAATLTRQLLAFSRKQMHHPEVVSLNDIVNSTSRLLRRVIGEHIDLEISLEPNLVPVFVDRSQMELVLLNLAANARDAMPNGGVLTIRTRRVSESDRGERIGLIVADTGLGIAESHKPHIFEPFFTTKEVGKGTGLGLSTVYGIVKQSQGDISVDSIPLAGTRFTISLPCANESLKPSSAVAAEPPAGGSGTILLVEDEDGLRILLKRVLEGQGYRVIAARDGEEAITLVAAQGEPVSLLLTDVVMPGLSGAALAEQLRRHMPGLRALFMSGHTADAQEAIGGYVADRDFLAKPFTPETMLRRIADVLNRS